MKVLHQTLAVLICGVAVASQAAFAGGPGCATCNGGGVGYAATPMHWGVPADVSYGQLAPTDWNAPASRSGCCGRPQRDMCDWWAGYCHTQRVAPCQTGDCGSGQRGWGEGYLGSSLCSGFQRACNNVGHGHGCGSGCCAPSCGTACCAPKCHAPKCCAPACSSGCGDCCSAPCGCGSSMGSLFGGLFGGCRNCCNVVGGSSGTAYCGCCSDACCSAPCCNSAPCSARQTFNGGCCNGSGNVGGGNYHPVSTSRPVSTTNDSYYPESGSSNATNSNVENDRDYAPQAESLPGPAGSSLPTPALRPTPAEAIPSPSGKLPAPMSIDSEDPAPALNDANNRLENGASDNKESF